MSRYSLVEIIAYLLAGIAWVGLFFLPPFGRIVALSALLGEVVLAIVVCVSIMTDGVTDRPRKIRAHKKKPEPPEIDDLPLIPPAAVRPGDKNEYGEYIFDPSWSANRFWLMGCKITSFEYRNYERW